jgi:hypothetical protein
MKQNGSKISNKCCQFFIQKSVLKGGNVFATYVMSKNMQNKNDNRTLLAGALFLHKKCICTNRHDNLAKGKSPSVFSVNA